MGLGPPKLVAPKSAALAWRWGPAESLKSIAVLTVLHAAALQVTRALVDPTMRTAGGSPRHTYFQGMAVQVLIAPLMALSYATWRRHFPRRGVRHWLYGSMLEPHAWPARLFFCNLMAHFLKDFTTEMSPLIAAHHVVCIATLVLQAYVLVDGANACLLGCAFLELGSAAYNTVKLYPSCARCAWLYLVVMTLSNLAAIVTMREWLKQSRGGPVVAAVVLAVTLGLALVRQQFAMADVLFGGRLGALPEFDR